MCACGACARAVLNSLTTHALVRRPLKQSSARALLYTIPDIEDPAFDEGGEIIVTFIKYTTTEDLPGSWRYSQPGPFRFRSDDEGQRNRMLKIR